MILPGLNELAGDVVAAEGHLSRGTEDCEESLITEKVLRIITGNLADLALDRQDWLAAEALAREALELAEALGRVELIGSDCYLPGQITRTTRLVSQEALPYAHRAVEIYSKLRMPEET